MVSAGMMLGDNIGHIAAARAQVILGSATLTFVPRRHNIGYFDGRVAALRERLGINWPFVMTMVLPVHRSLHR